MDIGDVEEDVEGNDDQIDEVRSTRSAKTLKGRARVGKAVTAGREAVLESSHHATMDEEYYW